MKASRGSSLTRWDREMARMLSYLMRSSHCNIESWLIQWHFFLPQSSVFYWSSRYLKPNLIHTLLLIATVFFVIDTWTNPRISTLLRCISHTCPHISTSKNSSEKAWATTKSCERCITFHNPSNSEISIASPSHSSTVQAIHKQVTRKTCISTSAQPKGSNVGSKSKSNQADPNPPLKLSKGTSPSQQRTMPLSYLSDVIYIILGIYNFAHIYNIYIWPHMSLNPIQNNLTTTNKLLLGMLSFSSKLAQKCKALSKVSQSEFLWPEARPFQSPLWLPKVPWMEPMYLHHNQVFPHPTSEAILWRNRKEHPMIILIFSRDDSVS